MSRMHMHDIIFCVETVKSFSIVHLNGGKSPVAASDKRRLKFQSVAVNGLVTRMTHGGADAPLLKGFFLETRLV
jgi:hypothetical protein